MILEKEILIKSTNSFTINHYKNLGYDVSFKEFIVSVDDLPRGSHQIITGSCDVCGKEQKQMYKTYLYSTDGTHCCKRCSKQIEYYYDYRLIIDKNYSKINDLLCV
jgi:hypothetical protein